MKPFFLVETTTRDKLIHQGIFFKPKKPGKRAVLWVHGLTSTFYGNRELLETFVIECEKLDWGFASFNNRGHDIVTGIKKVDRRKLKGYSRINGGTGYEVFKDCIFDIEAGIEFLTNQGFTKVIVIGHSTGANKVCYFAGKKSHPNAFGYVLASPVSDRLDPSLNKTKLTNDLGLMQELVNQGKGNDLQSGIHFFPATPRRFLSSFLPNSLEDQFDYGDPRPRMTYFSRIKKPILLILSGKDEYADRSVHKIRKIFDAHTSSLHYKSAIIPDALHSYNGKEIELIQEIISWILDKPNRN